ncbi:hypothetical protein F5Y14DRAFT_301025 [Nemania sp. NC0429]|nr:hypothetical protein F5Y14DRAFT_301025 [Nemania sp. NC0429]
MPISRKKACEQCRLAKAKCSLDGVCSRCANRGLACNYSSETSRAGPYTRPHSSETTRGFSSGSPASTTAAPLPLVTLDSGAPWLEFADVFREESTLMNIGLSDWEPYQAAGSRGLLRNLTGFNTMSEVATYPPLPGDSQHHESRNNLILDNLPDSMLPWDVPGLAQPGGIQSNVRVGDATEQAGEAVTTSNNLSQPDNLPSPTDQSELTPNIGNSKVVAVYGKNSEQFRARRQGATLEQSLTAKILIGQIEDYPKMLIRGSRLPPFIFPRCILNGRLCHQCTAVNGMHQCLPEPLANCALLTQMFYSHSPGNKQLVWRTIYKEQKRLREQYHRFDTTTLLAAVQALSIYVLIQAQDTEPVTKHDITCLGVTVGDMATTLLFRCDGRRDIYQDSNFSQTSWVIHESIRRIISLFYVINVTLVIQIGGTKRADCEDIRTAYLPCARDLWDPDATEAWAIRLHRYKSQRSSSRGLRINDLLNSLRSDHPGKKGAVNSPVQKDIATWCERLDDLGSLVWMASLLDLRIN